MESTDSKDTPQEVQKEFQHFILTRFNLLLWNKDKERNKVRSIKWLEHRFSLFEKYCLPSIKSQTCQDFEWIVLFDSSTPDVFKDKIKYYQKECLQFIPVFVEPMKGRYFAEIFRMEVVKRLYAKRVLTTYLDNDDALNVRFVEDLQNRATVNSDGVFFYYDEGYQYYTEGQYVMRIHYPRNHFVSVVEEGNSSRVKGIYGYGSHFYINKIEGVKIEHVKSLPMWCEVVHERNIVNDAYFLKARMMRDEFLLKASFGIQEDVRYGIDIYLCRFIPHYLKTFIRRCGYKLFGRHW